MRTKKSPDFLYRSLKYFYNFEECLPDRWDDASKVLEELLDPNMPSIYGVVGGVLKGEMDEGTNWQRVQYAFDGLKVDGVGSNLTFYNALLEALWCLGQRERACRVFAEAQKRGVLAEAFSRSDLMWSIDVHRCFSYLPYAQHIPELVHF